jgi:hypothetical protein
MRIAVAAMTLMFGDMAQAATDRSNDPGEELVAKIDEIAAQVRPDRSIAEKILGIPKDALADSRESYYVYKFKLGDVTLQKFTFERALILGFEMTGACISRDFVRRHYAPLRITATPQHSPEENTYYTKDMKWGRLSFGFPGNDFECLKSVVFNIAK